MKMAMRGKLALLLFCFFWLVSATLVLGKKDSELKQCRHQCKHQEQFGERQQREYCEQECERYYQEKQRRERDQQVGGGRDGSNILDLEEWANAQSPDERLRQENNPYVFEDHHFTTRIGGERGEARTIQKFTERSKLLRGISNFRLTILEVDPQTFITPNHWDSDYLLYVAQGRGTLSLIRSEKRENFNIRQGDVLNVPAGVTTYLINPDNNQKFITANLLRPVFTPGNFEGFFGFGGDNRESFYKAFSTEILEAAFNTRRDRLEQVFGQQREQIYIKASEEQIRALSGHEEVRIWPFGHESKGPFNLLDKRPTKSNQYGRLHEVDAQDYRDLRELNVAVSFVNITQGSMVGPFYSSKATKIAVVLNGEGYFEMACPHLSEQESGGAGHRGTSTSSSPSYQKVSSRLRRGIVYIVPAGHPVVTVASNDQNLEIICFDVNAENNKRMALAGKNNVVSQLEREAMQLAFGVSARQVAEVFRRQEVDFFFKGPRQPGRAEI